MSAAGYARAGRPNVTASATITRVVTGADVARIEREQDPFGIAHMCINPAGHQPIGSCGEIVCAHCGVIFWS